MMGTRDSDIRQQLDEFLPFARQEYEEAKIKHNLNPERFTFAWLEKLRCALEKVEAINERWKATP